MAGFGIGNEILKDYNFRHKKTGTYYSRFPIVGTTRFELVTLCL